MDCSMIDVCHFAVVEHIAPEGCPPVLVFQVEGKGRACKPLSLMHISSPSASLTAYLRTV